MDKSLVSKATTADDSATPGYMYREIAKITFVSVDASGQLRDFLLKKLKSSNVHQKIKALKVMKHCCQNGHATFRRYLQRCTGEIKECLGTAQALGPGGGTGAVEANSAGGARGGKRGGPAGRSALPGTRTADTARAKDTLLPCNTCRPWPRFPLPAAAVASPGGGALSLRRESR